MQRLNKDTLRGLVEYETDAAITIYLPTHNDASPPHISEDQIRFKNLISRAIDILQADKKYELAEEVESRAASLLEDITFWSQRSSSLLICLAKGFFETYALPVDSEEYIAVDTTFQLAPIIGIFSDELEFFVLELSEHSPVILVGDLYGLKPSNIELPSSFSEAMASDKHYLLDNGQGSGYPDRFFKIIDKIIVDATKTTNRPLILAGTITETAAYKKISHYPNILKTSITNSYDKSKRIELFQKVQPIIQAEIIQPQHKNAIEEYLRVEKSSPSLVAESEKQLLEAALAGRVDKLLTNMSLVTSDTVQDNFKSFPRITFKEPRLNSLINKVATMVWRTKGLVLNLQPEEMPNHSLIAAKLRY